MPGMWDSVMKRFIGTYGEHFTTWLDDSATFVQSLDVELKAVHLFADALLEVVVRNKPALLHVEFQTYDDPEMQARLLEYNVLASRQYGRRPVYLHVIYLRQGGEVKASPMVRIFPDDRLIHQFHYQVIKLWEYSADQLLQLGLISLVPLLTLTRDGRRPEVVKLMISRLVAANEMDLLAIARVIGGLVFTNRTEHEWFKRSFYMFQDVLRESWVYQEIGQEFLAQGLEQGIEQGLKQGIEKGREEERQHTLQRERQMLINLVQRRFPPLTALAEYQTQRINDPDVMQTVFLQLLDAQGEEEAKALLFEQQRNEEQH